MYYFDHAASSPVFPEVIDLLTKSLSADFANPNSLHVLGYNQKEKIDECRTDFLKALKAKSDDQFFFTSSASESNNTIIKGMELKTEDIVLYTKGDHASVVSPVEKCKAKLVEYKLQADGSIDVDFFSALLNANVKLVLISHVNNQSGVINDIGQLSKLVKEKSKAHVHIDAVQSFGKLELSLGREIDSMSIAGHKMGGPKGIAGLFIKKSAKVSPLIDGGGQEHGLRAGTESLPLIMAFHKAMQISFKDLEKKSQQISEWNLELKKNLFSINPKILFPFKQTSPYILTFIMPGISSDIVLRHLEMKEVYLSSTSACSSKIAGFNPTLAALGIQENFHKNILRVSFGQMTKNEEVEQFSLAFASVWNELKGF